MREVVNRSDIKRIAALAARGWTPQAVADEMQIKLTRIMMFWPKSTPVPEVEPRDVEIEIEIEVEAPVGIPANVPTTPAPMTAPAPKARKRDAKGQYKGPPRAATGGRRG